MKPSRHASDDAPRSPWRLACIRFVSRRSAVASLAILVILGSLCALAPWISTHSCEAQDLALGPTPPSARHWLGTDVLGRDLYTRLLYGGRMSFGVGLCATLVALTIGVTYGAISAYAGGGADAVLMRIVDTLYAIPFTLFVIVLTVAFGNHLFLLFAAIGAVEWLTMARIVRGQVLSVKEQPYIQAARLLDYGRARILFRHMIPNVIGPVIVYTTLTIPRVMMMEAFLSFLGLGVQPPRSSWGLLIRDGADAMESYPWLLIAPGLALTVTLFSLNVLGDALRDALDPRMESGVPP